MSLRQFPMIFPCFCGKILVYSAQEKDTDWLDWMDITFTFFSFHIQMQFQKPVLSVDEIIDLLQKRGLYISDISHAKHYLTHIWYFRLTWYCKFFQNEDNIFATNTSFEDIINLYVFDHHLRMFVFEAIKKIELSCKSIMNIVLCKNHDVFWYTKPNIFELKKDKNWNNITEKTLTIINDKKEKSASMYIKAYNEKYVDEKNLPSRMLFEELTLWETINIYKLLNKSDSQEISSYYNVYHLDMWIWLQIIWTIRNIVAHHWRLWNRSYIIKPRVNDVIFKNHYQTYSNENWKKEVYANFYNTLLYEICWANKYNHCRP